MRVLLVRIVREVFFELFLEGLAIVRVCVENPANEETREDRTHDDSDHGVEGL